MVDVGKFNLENMQHFMKKNYFGKKYKIFEYEKYYTIVIQSRIKGTISVPMVFNKKGALPIMKPYASFDKDNFKNPKLIYESK